VASPRNSSNDVVISVPFDVVVFDLDGTLVDTAPDLHAALNHALRALGRGTVDIEDVRHCAGEGARSLLRLGLQLTGGVQANLIDSGIAVLLAYYEDHICDFSTQAADLNDVLQHLHGAGVALGICTNKPERLARKLIQACGWVKWFESVVGGDSSPWKKPDPRPLQSCVLECGGGRSIFVGDSRIDLETARAAGIGFVAVTAGTAACKGVGIDADGLIRDFTALVPALCRIGTRN
jgi:phosphoglycolate phosphatase